MLGTLDKLPLEILHMILSQLDFHSLSAIMQTCFRGISVVESPRVPRSYEIRTGDADGAGLGAPHPLPFCQETLCLLDVFTLLVVRGLWRVPPPTDLLPMLLQMP